MGLQAFVCRVIEPQMSSTFADHALGCHNRGDAMTQLSAAVLAVALLATSSLAAAGQDTLPTFLVEQGHWWIARIGAHSCMAQNRPPQEFNAVPYNSVALHQQVGETQPRLQAFYWPDSFTAGQEVELLVVPSSGQPFQYPARAASDFHVAGVAPLTEAQFDQLTTSATVTIGGDAAPQSLVIEAKELAEVERWLDRCAR
jgi:hypothetical protein